MPTLEVRWIFTGELAAAVAGWFGRFPAQTEVLEDAYLLDPQLPGLSVKVREGAGARGEGQPRQPGVGVLLHPGYASPVTVEMPTPPAPRPAEG